MKKSFIFFSLALCLTVSFTACGNEEKEKPSSQISVNTMEESIVDMAVSELAESEVPPAENTDISEKKKALLTYWFHILPMQKMQTFQMA